MSKFTAENDKIWVRNNQETIVAFERELDALYTKAAKLLGDAIHQLPRVKLFFKPTGMTLGFASKQHGGCIVMNSKAIDINATNALRDTLPHEFAHIVCMFIPMLRDSGHGSVWAKVARYFGAKPYATTSSQEYKGLEPLRKHTRYVYMVGGRELVMTKKYHTAIQEGRHISTKRGERIYANNYVKAIK